MVGQIHNADGHENEPQDVYKNFWAYKRIIFWNYEINTVGEDNSKDGTIPILFGATTFLLLEQMISISKEPAEGIALEKSLAIKGSERWDDVPHLC